MGRAMAHLFADEGARVVIADLGSERVERVVDEIRSAHGDDVVLGVTCDVADHAQLHDLVEATLAEFGGIDIVINNAGVALQTSLFEVDDLFESEWATTLDVNLTAHARLVRLALPSLIDSGAGRVVNIASTEAIVTSAGVAAYTAAKAGVIGLTKSMAVELGRRGVTANCICPGPILTGMTEAIPDEARQTYARRRVPLRRYGIARRGRPHDARPVPAVGELRERGDHPGRRRDDASATPDGQTDGRRADGAPPGTRTLNQWVKSPLLCH